VGDLGDFGPVGRAGIDNNVGIVDPATVFDPGQGSGNVVDGMGEGVFFLTAIRVGTSHGDFPVIAGAFKGVHFLCGDHECSHGLVIGGGLEFIDTYDNAAGVDGIAGIKQDGGVVGEEFDSLAGTEVLSGSPEDGEGGANEEKSAQGCV